MVTHANRQSRSIDDRSAAPDTAVVDRDILDALASVIGRAKVDQFIADFIEHAGMHRRHMRDALATDDHDTVYRSAHMLVAVSGSLGAAEVSRLCDRLQRAVAARDMTAAREIYGDVDRAIDRALETMTVMIAD
jgi:HPt (histidine-containing phosphotransfer) domain-containing protein